MLPTELSGLVPFRQFILWIKVKKDGVDTKLPITINGNMASVSDPKTWSDLDSVLAAKARFPDAGIGFVFTKEDPFFFLDIDNARDIHGNWSNGAQSLVHTFPGAAVEVSQSGEGLHIIGTSLAIPPHKCKPTTADSLINGQACDLYTHSRFVALTFSQISGSVDSNHTDTVRDLIVRFYLPGLNDGKDWEDIPDGPVPEYTIELSDDELIEKALNSKSKSNLFTGKASFRDLWEANAEVLGKTYPNHDKSLEPFDHSKADQALMNMLAFWTGKDKTRMEQLFSRSILAGRDKWIDREEYRQATTLKAISNCNNVYTTATEKNTTLNTESTSISDGFLNIEGQKLLFEGCRYIANLNCLWTPDGQLYTPEQCKNWFGGYVYQMDYGNETRPSRNAFEAFTQSIALRDHNKKVHDICFRPQLPSGQIIDENGSRLVNTYVAPVVKRQLGDPAHFLDLLARVYPAELDQRILLSYFASQVQNPGIKFKWAPVLIGTEGNGKGTLINHLKYAVGKQYTHEPNAMNLESNFNSWMARKLLIYIDEIQASKAAMEKLKTMITSEELQIEQKGKDPYMLDNIANFIFSSNHDDAVKISKNSRRYCVMYGAQLDVDEKERSGLTDAYFVNYYHWVNSGGWEIVANYLHNYVVDARLDPARYCQTAPASTTSNLAIENSYDYQQEAIIDAVNSGDYGFKGGFISSTMANEHLKFVNKGSLNGRRLRASLNGIGYTLAPNLHRGRASMYITEGVGPAKRPVLYVQQGMVQELTKYDCNQITQMYLNAQNT